MQRREFNSLSFTLCLKPVRSKLREFSRKKRFTGVLIFILLSDEDGGGAVAPMTRGQTRMGTTFIDPKASAEQIVKAFIELFKKVFNL